MDWIGLDEKEWFVEYVICAAREESNTHIPKVRGSVVTITESAKGQDKNLLTNSVSYS